MTITILGISGFYHDSAAALLRAGDIVAAVQEERFSRRKHDAGFPARAIQYCLQEARLSSVQELDYIVFYDKPLLKFERLLETYLSYAPSGFGSFVAAMPVWLKDKLYLKRTLKKELAALGGCRTTDLPPLLFSEHHESHAASAFFPSPFENAAVLCLDSVGEWATTSAWLGAGTTLTPLWQIDFPHSLGLLYSAFTYYLGFKVNSGEYKLMGLAPYGEPTYVDTIYNTLIDVKEDGSFRLNLDYFDYCTGLRMTNRRFADLFGGPPRLPEGSLGQREMDVAASIQAVTENIVLRLAQSLQRDTNASYLCLAGGVALNCVANGKLLRSGSYQDIWVQPAAGDAGGALGAAYTAYYTYCKEATRCREGRDAMQGAYLGPKFESTAIRAALDSLGANYCQLQESELLEQVADVLASGHVVGWFQGRMEFGPRALGARSILADPRAAMMQAQLNLKIKFRESFRPFAPVVLAERLGDYFEFDRPSPYMLMVADIKASRRLQDESMLSGLDRLQQLRSDLPAITHVDYSARIQTAHVDTNPRLHHLLRAFERRTGCAVLVNTSFNVRGEPIVCTPADAYRCFMGTNMDYLIIEDMLLAKRDQPDALTPLKRGALALD